MRNVCVIAIWYNGNLSKKNIGAIAHDKCMCFVYTHEIHLIKR